MAASSSSSASGNKRRATDDESSLSSSKRQKVSSPASASGGSSRWKYDVFLSFRGKDTRNNITDHLYAALHRNGIITFKDDERLESGTEISSELTKAIEESRFSIVIFSKNYASSIWCLEELAKIVECVDTKNHTVIPVFYDVEAWHVRKQEGEFKKDFDLHQQNHDNEKIQRWRAASKRAADTSGYPIPGRPEAKVLEDIVNNIRRRLHVSSFDGNQIVGMDDHWEKMNARLKVKSDDVRFIGIYGMGGIGKTTIARYVYEKLQYDYEVRCFLGDVRQLYESSRGRIVALQEKLLSLVTNQTKFHVPSHFDGNDRIRRLLGSKKVLLVLDDVDNPDQLKELAGSHDWFGPKSRIIITTRDETVLKQFDAITYIYKVDGLNPNDALQLFRMKAFNKTNHPTDDCVNLSSDFVNYLHGHPLALAVLGSHLCGADVMIWKSTLESLKDCLGPVEKIMEVLRISYDGLKPKQKEIFLHIACFFKWKNKDRAMEILNSCDLCPIDEIKVLVDKSLITISVNRLVMHDLLQKMGWEIVREKHPDDRGKWSRLWLFEDVECVLTGNMGTGEVKGIMLNYLERNLRLNGESFSGMRNLMLLKLSNVDVSGDQICLPNNLRFLEWHGFPLKTLPSNFQARNLFELSLCGSQINYLWKGMKEFPKLKTIKLSNSHNLIETPDFTDVPNLEMLVLKGCTRLRKVHESIGVLKSLKILNLQGCSKLDKFPENLEELEHLEELDVGGTAIIQVPSSIARLTNLQKLSFQKCNSQPWWSMYLWRTNTRCLALPSLAGLCNLTILNLSECNLSEETLPKDLDSLCSLEVLNLSKNKFISLPESIKRLSKLEMLWLRNCKRLRSLPELPSNTFFVGAEGCHSLEDVSLRGCSSEAIELHLFNCPKLIQNRGHQEINWAVMLLKQDLQQLGNRLSNRCYISNPGYDIPEWFSCRSYDNSVKIGLPPNWLNDEFMGIAMCVVFTPVEGDISVKCRMDIIGNSYIFDIRNGIFKTLRSDCLLLAYVSREQFEHDRSLTLEVTNSVLVSTSTCIHARFEVENCFAEYVHKGDNVERIRSTGIRLVYKRDIECSEDNILPATDASTILHTGHNCSTLSLADFISYQHGNTGLRGSFKSREILMSYKLQVRSFRPYGDTESEFLYQCHFHRLDGGLFTYDEVRRRYITGLLD